MSILFGVYINLLWHFLFFSISKLKYMACYHKGIILVVSFFYVLCLHIHVLLLLQEVVCWVMLIPIATSCFLLNCNKFSIECDNGERAWSQELRAIPRRNCGAGNHSLLFSARMTNQIHVLRGQCDFLTIYRILLTLE